MFWPATVSRSLLKTQKHTLICSHSPFADLQGFLSAAEHTSALLIKAAKLMHEGAALRICSPAWVCCCIVPLARPTLHFVAFDPRPAPRLFSRALIQMATASAAWPALAQSHAPCTPPVATVRRGDVSQYSTCLHGIVYGMVSALPAKHSPFHIQCHAGCMPKAAVTSALAAPSHAMRRCGRTRRQPEQRMQQRRPRGGRRTAAATATQLGLDENWVSQGGHAAGAR